MLVKQDGDDVAKEKAAARAAAAAPPSKQQRLDVAGGLFYLLLLAWLAWVSVVLVTGAHAFPRLVLLSATFFLAANHCLARAVDARPRRLRALPAQSRPLFVNTAISLLHSALVGGSVTAVLLTELIGAAGGSPARLLEHRQLFHGSWPGVRPLLCVTTGYFAYDQWDMLRHRLYSPRAPGILVHHAVLLACFTLALARGVTLNYLSLTLVCEVHSVFLHERKVARLAGARAGRTAAAALLWSLNWTTFFTFRVAVHVLITCKLVRDKALFPQGVELPFALVGMALLNFLNGQLGSDMLRAFRRDMAGRAPQKRVE